MLFQIFLVAFAVIALWRTRAQYRAQAVSRYWFGVWSIFWVAVIVVALVPQTADAIASIAGVERGADLLVYIAVLVLSYATYRQMLHQRRLEQELTELVRVLALENGKKDHPST